MIPPADVIIAINRLEDIYCSIIFAASFLIIVASYFLCLYYLSGDFYFISSWLILFALNNLDFLSMKNIQNWIWHSEVSLGILIKLHYMNLKFIKA